MPTGADGVFLVSLPPAINIHSSVGDDVVCCASPCYHKTRMRPPGSVRLALLTVCEC